MRYLGLLVVVAAGAYYLRHRYLRAYESDVLGSYLKDWDTRERQVKLVKDCQTQDEYLFPLGV